MSKSESDSKITVACPSGHRLRGDAKLVGKTVKCPKCDVDFVFAPTPPQRPLSGVRPAPVDNRQVTDTGVMRILGDMTELPPPPTHSVVELRPCPRCGVAIPENRAVCNHCNCYVGVMPTFLKGMTSGRQAERN